MPDSLRSRCIEAGARDIANALANIAYNRGWPSEHPNEYLTIGRALAEYAIDAMLNCLTENADEWAEETHVPTLVGGDALALLAVLRNLE